MVVGLVTLLVVAMPAGASNGATSRETALRVGRSAEIAQYHGPIAPWYQEIAASPGSTSAWLSEVRPPGGKLRGRNSLRVISLHFSFLSLDEYEKVENDSWTGSGVRSSRQNSTWIRSPIDGDPRAMLRLGAALGVLYILFLGVWLWATRLRVRPPRSAPS
jgi:hypothetical protein